MSPSSVSSGAGKSTLVGLLLGWHQPTKGHVLVHGHILDESGLDSLRRATVWVDPSVALWNRSLMANLLYGASEEDEGRLASVIRRSALRPVLEALPEGLQTPLGKGGGLVSGGEGQRIRLVLASIDPCPRLAILDEAFRGLDGGLRQELLRRCRRTWHGATLLCVTHDVGLTTEFDRVVVVDAGRIAEQGPPAKLLEIPDGLYAEMLLQESEASEMLRTAENWRFLFLDRGRVSEERDRGHDL